MTHFPIVSHESEPAVEPLGLLEAKAYLKVTNASDDMLITGLITAVRKTAEQYMRISLIKQSWKLSYDKYAPTCVVIPFGPVVSITSVKAFGLGGSFTIIDSNSYYLSSGNRRLVFNACVLSHRVEITYVAGYGDNASDVPSPVRFGMLAHLAAIYDGRTGEKSIPRQAVEFYVPYREMRVS